ncbi:hypothetical protein [Kocuria kalidii]|uniref:hypothetical protein n=1 Tax=Kocuria kalidii TaxID=3376283 RepID=UPI003797AA00
MAASGEAGARCARTSQPVVEPSRCSGPREHGPDTDRIRTGLGLSVEGPAAGDVEVIEGDDGVRDVEPRCSVAPTHLGAA